MPTTGRLGPPDSDGPRAGENRRTCAIDGTETYDVVGEPAPRAELVLVIHRRDCPNTRNRPEPERWVEVDWGAQYDEKYPVDIVVLAADRAGLLRDIADVVASEGVNMLAAAAGERDKSGAARLRATLEIRQSEQLVRVMTKLERLAYVQSVRRVTT